jgi:hypothetical protein
MAYNSYCCRLSHHSCCVVMRLSAAHWPNGAITSDRLFFSTFNKSWVNIEKHILFLLSYLYWWRQSFKSRIFYIWVKDLFFSILCRWRSLMRLSILLQCMTSGFNSPVSMLSTWIFVYHLRRSMCNQTLNSYRKFSLQFAFVSIHRWIELRKTAVFFNTWKSIDNTLEGQIWMSNDVFACSHPLRTVNQVAVYAVEDDIEGRRKCISLLFFK